MKGVFRVISSMLICALVVCSVGAIQQPSNAIAGSFLLGGAAAAAAGSVLPIAIAGTLLVALGVAFIDRDALVTAAANLYAELGDLFDDDMAASEVLVEPATDYHKLVTHISDNTWTAARTWVQDNYDGGDIQVMRTVVSDSPIDKTVSGQVLISTSAPHIKNWSPIVLRYTSGSRLLQYEIYSPNYSASSDFFDVVFDLYDCASGSLISTNTYSNSYYLLSYKINGATSSFVFCNRMSSPWYGVSLPLSSIDLFVYRASVSTLVTVGSGVAGVLDVENYDYVNGVTGDRDIVIPLADAGSDALPDVSIDYDRPYVVPDNAVDNLLDMDPTDVPEQDASGISYNPTAPDAVIDDDAPTWLQSLLDGLISLFVPSQAQLNSWVANTKAFLQTHLGFLWQCWEILIATLHACESALSGGQITLSNWSVVMPTLTISGETLWSGGTVYPFAALTAPIWTTIHQFILAFGDAAVLYALVNFGIKKYRDWFAAGGSTQ